MNDFLPKAEKEINIKVWQLVISILSLLLFIVAGWININVQIKELQVNQNQQLKQIQINTNKWEVMQEQSVRNQLDLMQEIYEIKLLVKDKQNR